jgi:hypothetical protein
MSKRRAVACAAILLAGGSSAPSLANGRVAVVALQRVLEPADQARAEAIADAIERSGRRVVRPDEARAKLYGVDSAAERRGAQLEELRELDRCAQDAVEQLQMTRALDCLARAVGILTTVGPEVGEPRLLRRPHFLRGIVLRSRDELDLATQAFQRAAALDPGFEPSPTKYSPKILAHYRQAHQSATSSRCRMRFETTRPGAKVLVDSRPVGVTPLDLEVVAGTHFVRLTRPHHRPATRVVDACAESVVRAQLRPLATRASPGRLAQLDTAALQQARELLGASILVLLRVRNGQQRKAAFLPYAVCRTASAGHGFECSRGSVRWDGSADVDARAIVHAVRPSKEQRRWYRNGWLWTTVGVSLAAIVVGIVVPLSVEQDRQQRYEVIGTRPGQ